MSLFDNTEQVVVPLQSGGDCCEIWDSSLTVYGQWQESLPIPLEINHQLFGYEDMAPVHQRQDPVSEGSSVIGWDQPNHCWFISKLKQFNRVTVWDTVIRINNRRPVFSCSMVWKVRDPVTQEVTYSWLLQLIKEFCTYDHLEWVAAGNKEIPWLGGRGF